MKTVRLYDFSIPAVLSALLVFPFLFWLFLSFFLNAGRLWGLIAAVLLALSFLYLLYDLVFRAAKLDGSGASCGNVFIPRARLTVVSEYDSRFKEAVYRLRDTAQDYRGASDKELAQKEIRVQATHANTAKLQDYLNIPLAPAPRPKYRWKKQ